MFALLLLFFLFSVVVVFVIVAVVVFNAKGSIERRFAFRSWFSSATKKKNTETVSDFLHISFSRDHFILIVIFILFPVLSKSKD